MIKKNVALITGASSGLGAEFAKIHALKGFDLVLVARNEQKLTSLKISLEDTYGVNVKTISKDLSQPQAAREIYEEIMHEGIEISVLINNAGVDWFGEFSNLKLNKVQKMLNVNITAMTELTHYFLPSMKKKNQGKILNVSSVGSFVPGYYQSVFHASKAYVSSFSQALWKELEETGVTVTILYPSIIRKDFFSEIELDIPMIQKTKHAMEVAKIGYEAMEKRKLMAFDDLKMNFFSRVVVPVMPRKFILFVSKRMKKYSKKL